MKYCLLFGVCTLRFLFAISPGQIIFILIVNYLRKTISFMISIKFDRGFGTTVSTCPISMVSYSSPQTPVT